MTMTVRDSQTGTSLPHSGWLLELVVVDVMAMQLACGAPRLERVAAALSRLPTT